MTAACAYLVPEFPGQTHAFFWREVAALERLGVRVRILSTRRPAAPERCHSWTARAVERTEYLHPMGPKALLSAVRALLRAGPRRLGRCLAAAASARDAGLLGRLRLALLVVPAARLAALRAAEGWPHVHVHSCADSAMIAGLASILCPVTYSLTLHGPLRYFGPAQAFKWRGARFAIAVTARLRREVLATVQGIDPGAVETAAMGVDAAFFRRGRPWEPPRRGGPLRLVACGRLHRGKGHRDVIRATALLAARGAGATLCLIGEGPERPELEALVRELGLGDRVEFTGALSEEGVRARLEEASVFVLGSLEEAIGVATMEAMAMELPVVVTGVGGVAELVRDGVDGFLVGPGDPEAMAGAVERLARDPEAARRMGAAGAARVRESFTSRRSALVIARRLGVAVDEAPAPPRAVEVPA